MTDPTTPSAMALREARKIVTAAAAAADALPKDEGDLYFHLHVGDLEQRIARALSERDRRHDHYDPTCPHPHSDWKHACCECVNANHDRLEAQLRERERQIEIMSDEMQTQGEQIRERERDVTNMRAALDKMAETAVDERREVERLRDGLKSNVCDSKIAITSTSLASFT